MSKINATAPKRCPFYLPIFPNKTGNYALRVFRSGKTVKGDHYYVVHDNVAVRLATSDEIQLWHKVIYAKIEFESQLKCNGGASRYALEE